MPVKDYDVAEALLAIQSDARFSVEDNDTDKISYVLWSGGLPTEAAIDTAAILGESVRAKREVSREAERGFSNYMLVHEYAVLLRAWQKVEAWNAAGQPATVPTIVSAIADQRGVAATAAAAGIETRLNNTDRKAGRVEAVVDWVYSEADTQTTYASVQAIASVAIVDIRDILG
jgi:hypothetical protein